MDKAERITIFIPSYGHGGVERMLVNLANALAQICQVEIILTTSEGPYLDRLSPQVVRTFFSKNGTNNLIEQLADHIEQHHPDIVMSAKIADDKVAIAARNRLVQTTTKFVVRVGTTLTARRQFKSFNPLRNFLKKRELNRIFTHADLVLANSEGVAADLHNFKQLDSGKIRRVKNATFTPELVRNSQQPPHHPWLADCTMPVIIGIGGLRSQKDFSTLIKAFHLVIKKHPCRLIILGEGRQRERHEQLTAKLGISEKTAFPGFVDNPFSWLANASLFVLSSRWEGCPNVLIEALGVGTPVVSTDCPSGPEEILQNGKYGPLVPVGDAPRMAEAIVEQLNSTSDPDFLRQAALPYTPQASAESYLKAFGLAS